MFNIWSWWTRLPGLIDFNTSELMLDGWSLSPRAPSPWIPSGHWCNVDIQFHLPWKDIRVNVLLLDYPILSVSSLWFPVFITLLQFFIDLLVHRWYFFHLRNVSAVFNRQNLHLKFSPSTQQEPFENVTPSRGLHCRCVSFETKAAPRLPVSVVMTL